MTTKEKLDVLCKAIFDTVKDAGGDMSARQISLILKDVADTIEIAASTRFSYNEIYDRVQAENKKPGGC